MYDFHHNLIKKNFNTELLCTDADGFTYEIKSENVYEDFRKRKYLFDFSNYSKDSKSFLMIVIKKLLVKRKMNTVELLLMNVLD